VEKHVHHLERGQWRGARWAITGLAIVLTGLALSAQAQSGGGTPPATSDKPDFSGSWTFNSDLSDHPEQVSFGLEGNGSTVGGGGGGGDGGTGGRGGFGGMGRGGFGGMGRGGGMGGGGIRGSQGGQLSTDDRLKIEELADEVRDPSPSLTITQTNATVAVTDSQARTRTFRTNGKKDKQQLEAVTVNSKTKWDGPKLVTEYDLPGSRKLTYTYSLMPNTHQLLIEETLEGGRSGSGKNPTVIKRVYDPAAAKS